MTFTMPNKPATPRPSRMTLSSVTFGQVTSTRRTLVYGVGGVGKTTFACEFPSPVVLDTQDGSSRLNVARFPRPESWPDVLDAVNVLSYEKHDFKTFVIDLLDDIEEMIWSHVCSRDKQGSIEGYGGFGKGYKVALVEWRALIVALDRLRSKGIEVVICAHAAVKPFKNPEGDDYDRYTLRVHDGGAGLVRGWCDTVLFARHETALKVDAKKRVKGISTGARVIHTVESAAFYAKNRDGLPDVLPLDYAEYQAAIAAGTPGDVDQMMEEINELKNKTQGDVRNRVESAIGSCDNDAAQLARILNRLREVTKEDNK